MDNREVFLILVKAGLWKKVDENDSIDPDIFESLDWVTVQKLAEEQSVVGLVTAGIQNTGVTIPLEQKLKFLGMCQLIEHRNVELNGFIENLMQRLCEADIKALLVKGQGVAQCYAKPLWRSSGDVDLLVNDIDYKRAKIHFLSLLSSNKKDEHYSRHLGLSLGAWCVEIHGSLRTGLSEKVDKTIDKVQKYTFKNNKHRVWHNGQTDVGLPAPDDDIFFVFVHFLMHFYRETMCLRQICDWSRLLWTFRTEIDSHLLELRLQKAGLLGEWKTFAALAVGCLGMPVEAMPLYDESELWHKKGEKLLNFILKYRNPNKLRDTMFFLRLFPCNTLSFLPSIFFNVNRLKIKERIIGR